MEPDKCDGWCVHAVSKYMRYNRYLRLPLPARTWFVFLCGCVHSPPVYTSACNDYVRNAHRSWEHWDTLPANLFDPLKKLKQSCFVLPDPASVASGNYVSANFSANCAHMLA
jgi:hypothetical protein